MKKTPNIIGILAVVIFIVGAIVFATQSPSIPTSTGQNPATGTPNNTGSQAQGTAYTLADVAKHNTAASCWTAINGGVYDLTAWISQHPGGEGAILSICGADGSAAFNDQHGSQGRPEQILATFKIGTLKS